MRNTTSGMDWDNAASQFMPNWFFGMMPPTWWPDRPRDPRAYTLNILPLASTTAVQSFEQIFNKRRDVAVFGGIAHVVDNQTQQAIACPLGGVWTRILMAMRNPASGETYTNNTQPTVPLENWFSVWQRPGDRPCYWPIPIYVPRGGSLALDLLSLAPVVLDVRITFYSMVVFDRKDRSAT